MKVNPICVRIRTRYINVSRRIYTPPQKAGSNSYVLGEEYQQLRSNLEALCFRSKIFTFKAFLSKITNDASKFCLGRSLNISSLVMEISVFGLLRSNFCFPYYYPGLLQKLDNRKIVYSQVNRSFVSIATI